MLYSRTWVRPCNGNGGPLPSFYMKINHQYDNIYNLILLFDLTPGIRVRVTCIDISSNLGTNDVGLLIFSQTWVRVTCGYWYFFEPGYEWRMAIDISSYLGMNDVCLSIFIPTWIRKTYGHWYLIDSYWYFFEAKYEWCVVKKKYIYMVFLRIWVRMTYGYWYISLNLRIFDVWVLIYIYIL